MNNDNKTLSTNTYSYSFSKEIDSKNDSFLDNILLSFKESIRILDSFFYMAISCNFGFGDILGFKIKPIPSKLFNKIPLVTILNIGIINDILINTIYCFYCFIVGNLMIYVIPIYLMFSLLDIAFLSDFIKKKKSIYFVFMVKTLTLIVMKIGIYIFSHIGNIQTNEFNNLSIYFLLANFIQNIITTYIIWSAKKQKISLNEDEYITGYNNEISVENEINFDEDLLNNNMNELNKSFNSNNNLTNKKIEYDKDFDSKKIEFREYREKFKLK